MRRGLYICLRNLLLSASLTGFTGVLMAEVCPFCGWEHAISEFFLGKWYTFWKFSNGFPVGEEQIIKYFSKLSLEDQNLYLMLLEKSCNFHLNPQASPVKNFETARTVVPEYNNQNCYYLAITLGFIYTVMRAEKNRFNEIISILKSKRSDLLDGKSRVLEIFHAQHGHLQYGPLNTLMDRALSKSLIDQLETARRLFDKKPEANCLLICYAPPFDPSSDKKEELLPNILKNFFRTGEIFTRINNT